MYTSHIKAPVLKEILQEDKPCEEKLNKLKDLVGIPSEVPASETNSESTDATTLSKEKILANLSPSGRKLANKILDYIATSDFISWNADTLELILDGNAVEFSNIETLIGKVVETLSPIQPVAFVLFIDALLKLKVPQSLFRAGDAINTRAQILLIKNSAVAAEPETVSKAVNQNLDAPVEGTTTESNTDETNTFEQRKRRRDASESEDESENFTARSKRRKVFLTDANEPATVTTKRKQRTPKLNQAIIDAGWEAYNE